MSKELIANNDIVNGNDYSIQKTLLPNIENNNINNNSDNINSSNSIKGNKPITLMDNFLNTFSEDMSDKDLLFIILKNSFLAIWGKIMISLADTITASFLGHLKGDELYPYFMGCLIQNIGFRGIGYGLLGPVSILCSQAFGSKKMNKFGGYINKGRIVAIVFSVICIIFCFVCKPIISVMMGDKDVDLIQFFLLHNLPSMILNFQIVVQLVYFNSQNQYFYPAVLDSVSLISHFLIFLTFFNIFNDFVLESTQNTLLLTAWCINFNSLLHYLYYIIFTYYKNLSPGSNFCINKDTFKNFFGYIKIASQCVLFFLSHFVAGEILSIMLNNKNGYDKTAFNINKIVNSYYFIFNKIPLSLSFFSTTIIGNFLTNNYYGLIKISIKIMIIYSSILILIIILFTEILANYIGYIYTDKDIVKDVILYLRISILTLIPNNFEMLFQGIITGYGKQKVASICSVLLTIGGGVMFGYIFIFSLDMNLLGVYLTTLIIECLLMLLNGILLYRIDVQDTSRKAHEYIENNH